MPSNNSKKRGKGHKYKANLTDDLTSIKLGSLDELLKAMRTVLDLPWEGSILIPWDVLWSDPSSQMGLSLNKEQDNGLLWGPDITQQFLRTNHLKRRTGELIMWRSGSVMVVYQGSIYKRPLKSQALNGASSSV